MALALPDARELSDEVLEALRLRALRGCELGLLVRTGAGTKAEAFRYALAPPQPAA